MHPGLIIAFVVVALAITAIARRKGLVAPLILTAVGLGVSYIPAVPHIELSHEVILGVVLPPLLYSAATSSSYQDMRASLHAITRLGVGAVVVTAVAVAGIVTWLFPSIPFLAALVLGAVVAPPDAVAAVAVGHKLGLPRRVMTVLTGESLINDATSLTLYKVTLAGVASGVWSMSEGLSTFALAVFVGVGVGLVLGFLAHRVRQGLGSDPTTATLVSILVPFICYWSAEELQGSGVLAVVAAGLYLGRHAPSASYATRLREEPIWKTIELALEMVTFAIIGLQLRWIVAEVQESTQGLGHAIAVSLVVFATVILIRPVYILVTAKVDSIRLPGSPRPKNDVMSFVESAVVSWAGMRGVVTLAAALSIPVVAGAAPFPERATVQLAAYSVAIGTLLLQGLTLPWVIRRLGLNGEEDHRIDAQQEIRVRAQMAKAQSEVIDKAIRRWAPKLGEDTAAAVADTLRARMIAAGAAVAQMTRDAESVAAMSQSTSDSSESSFDESSGGNRVVAPAPAGAVKKDPEQAARLRKKRAMILHVRRELLGAQRRVLADSRDNGEVNETVMRAMLREIDYAEESLTNSWLNRVTD